MARLTSWSHFTTANGLRSDKSIFLGFDAARLAMGRIGSWRGCFRSRALAALRPFRRVDLGRLQHQRVLRRHGRQRVDRHQPRSFAIPALAYAGAERASAGGVHLGQVRRQDRRSGAIAEMPYRRNSLQVRFAALTFVQESSVVFRYRLAEQKDGSKLRSAS